MSRSIRKPYTHNVRIQRGETVAYKARCARRLRRATARALRGAKADPNGVFHFPTVVKTGWGPGDGRRLAVGDYAELCARK